MYWNFFQDGTLQIEIKLTGILNIYVLGEGESAGKHGTEVAPRVTAHHHQHLFSVRVDPMIDGLDNSVCETDVVASDEPTGSDAVRACLLPVQAMCADSQSVLDCRTTPAMLSRPARPFSLPPLKQSGTLRLT